MEITRYVFVDNFDIGLGVPQTPLIFETKKLAEDYVNVHHVDEAISKASREGNSVVVNHLMALAKEKRYEEAVEYAVNLDKDFVSESEYYGDISSIEEVEISLTEEEVDLVREDAEKIRD